jgi:predicted ABC-type sugar transport system permease subunit
LLINGLIIAKLKIADFAVTLGMMIFARGLAYAISGGRTIFGVSMETQFLGKGKIYGTSIFNLGKQTNISNVFKNYPFKTQKLYVHIHELVKYEEYEGLTSHELAAKVKDTIQIQLDKFEKMHH